MLICASKRTKDQDCSVVETVVVNSEKRRRTDAAESTDRQEKESAEEEIEVVDAASEAAASSQEVIEVDTVTVPESNDDVHKKLNTLLNMVSKMSLSPSHAEEKETSAVSTMLYDIYDASTKCYVHV